MKLPLYFLLAFLFVLPLISAAPPHLQSQATGVNVITQVVYNVTLNETTYQYNYNQTLAVETLYGKWFYNQTKQFTDWLAGFKYDYNQTTPAITYASGINTSLSARIDGIAGANASWNQSTTDALYANIKWGYNMTSNSIYYYNQSLATENQWKSLWYNYSLIPVLILPNSTTLSIDNITNFLYNYNQTSSSIYYYNQTSSSIYYYNQSLATENQWKSLWYNYSLIPVLILPNSTTLDITNITNFLYNYNQSLATENQWKSNWYNHTSAVETLYGKWFYNMSISSPFDYNHTLAVETLYGKWFYNMTTQFTDWLATFKYNYNQTAPANSYTDAVNISLSGRIDGLSNNATFNQSLTDTLYSDIKWGYNMTSNSIYYYNQSLATENQWKSLWYNYSLVPIIILPNSTTLDITNITNFLYNYNQTSNSIYYYNQSLATENQWKSLWYNYSLIPVLILPNSTTLDITNITNFLYNYNQSLATETQWKSNWYNHTSAVETLYGKWFYNMSISSPFDYNHTLAVESLYGKWFYNMTTQFTDWLATFKYNYNQTAPANSYTDAVNISLSGRIDGLSNNATFNQSLTDTLYSDIKWGYNMTLDNSNQSFNQSLTDSLYLTSGDYLTKTGTNGTIVFNNSYIGIGQEEPISVLDVAVNTTTNLGYIHSPFLSAGYMSNWILNSETFSSNWTNNTGKPIYTNNVFSPIDTLSAENISGTSDSSSVWQVSRNSSAGCWTFSVYAKAMNNPTTMNISLDSSSEDFADVVVNVTMNWKRFSNTQCFTGGNNMKVEIIVGNNNIALWGAQLDYSSIPRTYFYTSTSPVTEGARTVLMTSLQTASTIYAENTISTSGDYYSTGGGDDLWLGSSTQSSGLFRAYASGGLSITNLSVGNVTRRWATINGTGYANFSGLYVNETDVYPMLYNYSLATENQWKGLWYNYSLIGTEVLPNSTTLSINNITNFLYNYNQTSSSIYYYNQTSSSIYYYNQSLATETQWMNNWYNHTLAVEVLYGKWFYNMTQASVYDYNHTLAVENLYGKWFYNMTTQFTDWLTGFKYDYNTTAPAISYTNEVNASLYTQITNLPTGNSTFNQSLTDSQYVKKSGDTMTGNLNLSLSNITSGNEMGMFFNETCTWIKGSTSFIYAC